MPRFWRIGNAAAQPHELIDRVEIDGLLSAYSVE